MSGPPDDGLGPPKRAFADTFSAETVVMETWFPDLLSEEEKMKKQPIPQRQNDVSEIEAALQFMKQGRFKDVMWLTLREAVERLEAEFSSRPRSNASPKGGGLCGHEIPLDWHCPKCAREAEQRGSK